MNQFVPLITSLALVAFLSCAMILLMKMAPAPSAPSEKERPAPVREIFSLSQSQIDTIEIIGSDGKFHLVNEGDRFCISGQEQVPVSSSAVQELLALLEHFPFESVEGSYSSEKASLYGFNTPVTQITIFPVQSSPVTLLLGHPSHEHYFITDGIHIYEEPVRTIGPLLLNSPLDYADPSITPGFPEDAHQCRIELSGTAFADPLTIEASFQNGKPSFRMLSPEEKPLPADSCLPLLKSLYGLSADEVSVLSPSPEELYALGMNDPYGVVNADCDGKHLSLIASAPGPDETVHIMNEAIPVLFQVKADSLEWLSSSPEVLTRSVLFPLQYEETTAVVVTSSDETFRFTKWEGQVLCNGIPAEEKSFRSFYETELSITPLRRALTAPSAKSPMVSVSLHYNSGRKDVLLFLPGPHGAVFLSYNGKTDFLVRDTVPAHIIESCRRILSQKAPVIR